MPEDTKIDFSDPKNAAMAARPVPLQQFAEIVEAQMKAMRSHRLAIEALQKRVAELEAGSVRYLGVWQAGQTYTRGVFVTREGSVWHCNAETTGKPGQCADWVLAVKSGRDGRDAR